MHVPTYIYWLIDTRPETIAAGWHSGYPFYCGKTIGPPEKRLKGHRYAANAKLSQRLEECGRFVVIKVIETVPASGDWQVRERHLIELLRFSFPDNCNIADGGQGGFIELTRDQRLRHRNAIRSTPRCVKAWVRRQNEARDPKKRLRKRMLAHKLKMRKQQNEVDM